MIEGTDLRDKTSDYIRGSKSKNVSGRIVNRFHKEVIRQLLLGNKVIFPAGITAEIVRFEETKHYTVRIGYGYHVVFRMAKLKKKKVKYTPSVTLMKKLDRVLKETSVEYKLASHGHK